VCVNGDRGDNHQSNLKTRRDDCAARVAPMTSSSVAKGALWREHMATHDAMVADMRAKGIPDVPWSSSKRLQSALAVHMIYTSWVLSPILTALAMIFVPKCRVYVFAYLFASAVLKIRMPVNALHRYFCWLSAGETNGWALVFDNGEGKGHECELDCEKNTYLFASHPHGLFTAGVVNNLILSESALAKVRAPLVRFFINEFLITVFPLIKDALSSLGFVACTAKNMKHYLSKGESGCIVVGGVKEVVLTGNIDVEELYLRNAYGFVKVAIQSGASLVPVYTFGESLATGPDYVPFRELRKKLTYKFDFPFRSLDLIHRWGLCFPRGKLTTVIGAPIKVEKNENPTREEVKALHAKYCDTLLALIERNKVAAGYPSQVTRLV
jgi:diacylglycerol O-acyltransferase 2, plant